MPPSDSSHRGRTVIATACADPPAQSTQPAQQGESQESPPRPSTGRGANATACADPPAQDSAHNAAPESAPAPQSGAMQHSNPASRSDNTACAAPPAQAFPVSLRHPGPYGISAPSTIGSNPAPQPGFSRINLIYRPAIRNDGKHDQSASCKILIGGKREAKESKTITKKFAAAQRGPRP
jgi:hypothetical protein